jgi:UDP-N-acetylmuramate--alanine ligase
MKHVHLIGIGGTGLSAIARVLLQSGYTVSGSDQTYTSLAESVEAEGARVHLGHRPENLKGAEIVVRSSAVPDENIEVLTARAKGIPVLKRADFLGQLMVGKFVIGVAGTHGKTSTTAMIAWMLTELGQDPSFILGGVITGLGVNAKSGSGSTFVIEADEYDRMFLGLKPQIAVVTNIEHDHPDCFPTSDNFRDAFREFIHRLPPDGRLLACGDDEGTADVLAVAERNGHQTLTYGIFDLDNNYQAINLNPVPERGGFAFLVTHEGIEIASISLLVPGKHNVQNALAAIAVADQLGLPPAEAAQALSTFQGTSRRFEKIGESQGVTIISDYGHHPTEIKTTLSAARSRYPERNIWAVWQPHTYSRTKLLIDEFRESFRDAHNVVVTEIYPAREPVDITFSSRQMVDAMAHPNVCFTPSLSGAVEFLLLHLRPGDVMIVFSAGDADQICNRVLSELETKG